MTEINAETAADANTHPHPEPQPQTHAHTPDHAASDPTIADDQYWNDRYGQSERMWTGNPNAALVHEVADLPPGDALDLGCGEGGDAIWLATRGWRVTAVDVSRVAMDRGAAHAAAVGADVAERIDWQLHDLGTSFPVGSYDLVSAQFLYFRSETSREQTLRSAAKLVAPGGILLIEGHSGHPTWEGHSHPELDNPTPAQTIEFLELADGEWEVLRSEEHERVQNDPDGNPTVRTDSTVKLRRLDG